MQSRYYDPKICRFINADSYTSTGQGILGFNMFAYCRNNPVSRMDAAGTDDVCVAANDDNNPFNDVGGDRGGLGGGAGGNGYFRGSGGNGASPTVIYRWNCKDAKNLMPSNKDARMNSPMSFSTIYRPGSAMTTIEDINATGYLKAVQDNSSHVSVYPLGGTVSEWRHVGIDSIWTKVLAAIVEFLK